MTQVPGAPWGLWVVQIYRLQFLALCTGEAGAIRGSHVALTQKQSGTCLVWGKGLGVERLGSPSETLAL